MVQIVLSERERQQLAEARQRQERKVRPFAKVSVRPLTDDHGRPVYVVHYSHVTLLRGDAR